MDIGKDAKIVEIISRLGSTKVADKAVKVEGTWGSFGALLAGFISKKINRPILYISPHIDDADKVADDLHAFGRQNVDSLTAWEGAEDLADATDEIRAERLRLTIKVSANKDKLIIPASIQSLCQPVADPKAIEAGCLQLEIDKKIPPEKIIEWLVDNAFENVERIDLPGQYARRGGIIDIYAPLLNEKTINPSSQSGAAIRIEFFGDEIESIRRINLDTLLSGENISDINIVSPVCGHAQSQRELFINTLPADTIIILEEPATIQEVAHVFVERSDEGSELYSWDDIHKAIGDFTQLHLSRFATGDPADFIKVDVKSVQEFQHKAALEWSKRRQALDDLVQQAKEKEVYLYCEAAAEIKRITEIIEQDGNKIPENFHLQLGFINQGFAINSLGILIISHHELFGQFAVRRKAQPMRAGAPIDTLTDLQAGDYVVHVSYGIGKFIGINTIKNKDSAGEYLTIEFADKVKIHVSVSNITLIQKYIGTSPKRPPLSKVGSKKWLKQKERVQESVQDLAVELLELQAKRQNSGGISYDADSTWQAEFDESFPYQETADQTITAEEIKADMRQPIVMDRLLCGDVGYGKTELAMRAAFKAVEGGKQVAVLVPTTVLCVQHGRSFTERFADFPVSIEVLNRFKTTRQAAEIIGRAKKGQVDILIGTHRILSADVGFQDLGLIIIDEEQRFGVTHKEKLKKLRFNVDVLTMTATPIPRTLYMSMLGLRDISSLGTPPLDRRSVVTRVTAYNDNLIRKVILHELNRQGQVFFLHNRVKSIERKALQIKKLVPDAKLAVAHGQMPKSQLEKAMIDFVTGKIDVLVCTTIIESGLDIPNANTILIDNADRFGLAELHQLRGRVGRYKHRAYAYLLLPQSRPVSPLAARRLKAIEEYSHLGAGFKIALRDLEIRGAGNILGSEQSGHIQIVGYQMYCQLLAEAVRKLKEEPSETSLPAAVIDLGLAAYIPKNYIPLDRGRMEAYRRVAVAKTDTDIEQIKNELTDMYGQMPDEAKLMLELTELGIKAGQWGIEKIYITGSSLAFSFTEPPNKETNTIFERIKAKVTIPDPKTVYLHLAKNYFEQPTLMRILQKILA